MKNETQLLLFIVLCFASCFALPFVILFAREIDTATIMSLPPLVWVILVMGSLGLLIRREIKRY